MATASLPDSVFGGSYDWATGAVTVTKYQYVPKGTDITNYGTASTGVPYVQLTLPEKWSGSGAMCSHYRIVSGAPSSAAIRLVAPVGCYIYDPRFTDRATAAALLDAEKVQIVYDLQSVKAVQVEPVELMLLKGGNAIWSGVGDTAVRYVVDTKTYVDTHAGGGGGAPYVLPVASTDTLGGVKVGEGLEVAEDGTVGVVPEGEWVEIESITLSEGIHVFERTAEPNGAPYNLDAIKIMVKLMPEQGGASYHVTGYDKDNKGIVGGMALKVLSANGGYFIFNASPLYGFYNCWAASGNQGGPMQLIANSNGQHQTTPTSKKIKKLSLSVYDQALILAGTTIKIWGVRANA